MSKSTVISSFSLSSFISASLMVFGTSVGAGMLGIPLMTAEGGFGNALFVTFLVWLFMAATGLILLEATLRIFYELRTLMERTIDVPLRWVEEVATLVLPEKANQHLQQLMDRNNDGLLSDQERTGLAALVELSERLSLVRGEALYLLGRKP